MPNLWPPDMFFKPKMHQNRFRPGLRPGPRWGSSRRSPDRLVGWGGGHPLPIPLPLDVFGVSTSAPSAPRFWPPPIQIPGYAPDCNQTLYSCEA